MFDKNEMIAIIEFIKTTLNQSKINLKELTNYLYLIEWNFIEFTEYRLFNYKWTNNNEDNINLIKEDLIKNNFKLEKNTRYFFVETNKNDYQLSSYIKKSIENLLKKEDLNNKLEFYFLETLPFDLFYKKDNIEINLIDLVKKKKNKEY